MGGSTLYGWPGGVSAKPMGPTTLTSCKQLRRQLSVLVEDIHPIVGFRRKCGIDDGGREGFYLRTVRLKGGNVSL